MTQTPDRPGIDQLTSDQLNELYTRLDKAERAVTCWKTRARIRAQQAEATLNAVRALANHIALDSPWGRSTADRIRAVLDQHGQTPGKCEGTDPGTFLIRPA